MIREGDCNLALPYRSVVDVHPIGIQIMSDFCLDVAVRIIGRNVKVRPNLDVVIASCNVDLVEARFVLDELPAALLIVPLFSA